MKILKLRRKLKMMIIESERTQSEIAARMGVTRQYLNYVINKATKLSTLEKLEERIKEVLK